MPTYVCALHFSPFFVEKQNIPLRHQGASGAGNQCYQIWRILLVIHRTTKLVNCYCNAVTLDKKGLNDSLVKYPQILKNGCKKKNSGPILHWSRFTCAGNFPSSQRVCAPPRSRGTNVNVARREPMRGLGLDPRPSVAMHHGSPYIHLRCPHPLPAVHGGLSSLQGRVPLTRTMHFGVMFMCGGRASKGRPNPHISIQMAHF